MDEAKVASLNPKTGKTGCFFLLEFLFAAVMWIITQCGCGFTMIIGAVGYQMSYRISAILCLVLLIPWVFVFKFTPEEKGLKPYGWTPEEEIIAKNAEGANKAGISASKAFATPAFAKTISSGAVASHSSTQRRTPASSVTSSDLACTSAPSARHASATAESRSSFRPQRKRLAAPLLAHSSASASPIPLEAPVMRTFLAPVPAALDIFPILIFHSTH